MGTVSRNFDDGSPLVVTLQADVAGQVQAPLTVTIPAGDLSAAFTLPTIDNGLVEANRTVTVTASATAFPDDQRTITINDDDRPQLNLLFDPDSIREDGGISTVTVSRTGNLSEPLSVAISGNDASELSVPTGVTIPAGASSTTFVVTGVDEFDFDGDQVVTVTARPTFAAGGLVGSGTAFGTVTVTDNDAADYTATASTDTDVAIVEGEVRPTVVITGSATFTGGGSAVGENVSIFIRSRGTLRTFTATTDASGDYQFDFVPLPGEAGRYEISAGFPGAPAPPASDAFEILAFRATLPSAVTAIAGQTTTVPTVLQLTNASQLPLTGVTATILSGMPDGATLTIDLAGATSIDSMPAGNVVNVGVTVDADASTSVTGPVVVRFQSDEGTFIDRIIPVTVRPSAASLELTSSTLIRSVVRGQSTVATFVVTNTGGTATDEIDLRIPSGLDWITSALRSPIAPIEPGESRTFTLQLNPPSDLTLGTYTGTLVVTDGAVGVNVPFDIDVTGELTGTLGLLVEDDFTIEDDAAGLVGAMVTITDAGTGDVVFTGDVTDPTGLLSIDDLTEGTYRVRVTAEDHLPAENLITIAPGIVNEVTVFLPVQVVSYEFVVTETEIEDITRVTVEAVFNSTVPAPVLRLIPDQTDLTTRPFVDGTEQLTYTLQNDGLIALDDLQISLPTHPAYEFETVSTELGRLEAGQTIQLPVLVRRTLASVPVAPPLGPVWVNLNADYTYLVKPKDQPSFTVANQATSFIMTAIPLNIWTPQLPSGGSFGGGGGGYWSGGSVGFGGGVGQLFAPGTPQFGGTPSVTQPSIPVPDEGGVPVEVRVQLTNDFVQTRQAFEAALEINNGSTFEMQDFDADLLVFDSEGNEVTGLFGVTSPVFSDFGGVSGDLTLPSTETGTTLWTIIPSLEVSRPEPTTYFVGGSFSYSLGDVDFTVDLTLVDFVVAPQPELFLDYFLQRDAVSDDPFTRDRIEPAIPGDLVVRVQNRGDGVANNLRVIGYQPEIIENEQGLAIAFVILSTDVNDEGREPTLSVTIGELAPGETAIVRWQLVSTLQGIFEVDPTATTITHVSSIDGSNRLSLIPETPGIFNLIHVARDYGTDAGDTLLDFLTDEVDQIPDDIHDDDGIPDTIRFSDVGAEPQLVGAFGSPTFNQSPTPSDSTATLDVTVPDDGWNFVSVLFPGQSTGFANWQISQVRRSDGTVLPIENAWITDRTFPPGGGRPTYENRINLVDKESTGSYLFTFAPLVATPPVVSDLIIQEGQASRAIVNQFAVQFDREMNLQSLIDDGSIFDAVTLTNLGVDTEADADVVLDLRSGEFAYVAGGVLSWTYTSTGPRDVSIPDGLYQLTLDASVIASDAGVFLDGDGDGIAGVDYVTTFHRLSADTDGNAIVDADDIDRVNENLGRREGGSTYDSNSDLDGDGRITTRDRVIASRARNNAIVSPTPAATTFSRFDATSDGRISALDALAVINYLGRQSTNLEAELISNLDDRSAALDVNGDNRVSALDALQVLNELHLRNQPPNLADLDAEEIQVDQAWSILPSQFDNDQDDDDLLLILAQDQSVQTLGK